MDREVFFDWLEAMVLSDDNSRGLWWEVMKDDRSGTITVKFHDVEEIEEDDDNG